MKINPATIYLGDNGRALCGEHLGVTAKMTGHDLSGQAIMPVTPEVAKQAVEEYHYLPECEQCGKKASLLLLDAVRIVKGRGTGHIVEVWR